MVVFVVEYLRLVAYSGFWFTLIMGVILTKAYAGLDFDDTLLTQVYGFNNVCVNFDYPPATYVLPGLWAIALVLFMGYLGGQTILFTTHAQEGKLSWRLYYVLAPMKIFEAVCFIFFSTIFAVSPTGPDTTMWVHTIPWLLLQIGLLSLAISNALHGWFSGYWVRLAHGHTWPAYVACCYIILVLGLIITNMVLAFNCLLGMPTCVARVNGTGWDDCQGHYLAKTESLNSRFRAASYLFFVCVAVIPMIKAGLLVFFRRDEIEKVEVVFNLANNKVEKKRESIVRVPCPPDDTDDEANAFDANQIASL